MILAPDHVRDLHQGIVDDDGEVVSRPAVGAQNDGVADGVGMKPHGPSNHVLEGDRAILWNAETNRGPLTGRETCFP